MATYIERIWKRHSNPWSVWSRILSYPLVYVPLWNRSWKQGAAIAAWFAANPVLFPEPESDESWATRGVLGEELWTAERPRDLSMLINTASAASFAGGLFATYRKRFWPMVCFASAALLLKLWYVDRMTFYYAQRAGRRARVGPWGDPGATHLVIYANFRELHTSRLLFVKRHCTQVVADNLP